MYSHTKFWTKRTRDAHNVPVCPYIVLLALYNHKIIKEFVEFSLSKKQLWKLHNNYTWNRIVKVMHINLHDFCKKFNTAVKSTGVHINKDVYMKWLPTGRTLYHDTIRPFRHTACAEYRDLYSGCYFLQFPRDFSTGNHSAPITELENFDSICDFPSCHHLQGTKKVFMYKSYSVHF